MSSPGQRIQTFCPAKKLGEYIRFLKDQEGESNFVTFLIGAGFSKSAGIPLAGEIVEDLKKEAEHHPLLRNAGKAPKNTSEYVHLMEKLGSPKERAKRIKRYIDKARDTEDRLKINWSHLLLATLVEKGYVNRILTTNFDPLVVEALALSGQPIRTYDLNTTGAYYPGTLDAGSVIYLHGQMHSLLLVNSGHEMEKMAALYPPVLQEAVQNSILITVGYSGDCDPVLDGLLNLPNFPRGIWWSQYGKIEDAPCEAMQRLSEKFGTDCHLAIGDDSDTFMRKLVLDGMKLDLPDEVMTPLAAMRKTLERITPYPQGDTPASDPVPSAIDLLKRLEEQLSRAAPSSGTKSPSGKDKKSEAPVGNSDEIKELSLIPAIEMAALNSSWEEFNKLTEKLKPSKGSRLAQTIADGLINQASAIYEMQPDQGIELLKKSKDLGPSAKMSGWLLVIWGNALLTQAEIKGNSPQADRFHKEAEEKYAEALRIKPDMHEAAYGWGNAFLAQAETKGNSPEADRLYKEAGEKYADALRIRPNNDEAAYNWGIALVAQAQTKGNSPEAAQLYKTAREKYTEALRIKPDDQETVYNLACLYALEGDINSSLNHLINWKELVPTPSRSALDDPDFDKIRDHPDFIAFRDSLPE